MSDFKRNLMESTDAAARVGALFVAVALFAAMWESDSPATASHDNWLARRAGSPATVVEVHVESSGSADSAVAEGVTSNESKPVFGSVSLQSGNSQPYPMPAGIARGEYRVVDSFGMTDTLRVTTEMVSIHDSHKTRDQYIVEDGDRKIFFIRIRRERATAHVGSVRR
ncbi:MAG: hypothetical protein HQ518_12685 [Rhodopirellula sp.]|nr:hypothetical protein [Rhodopirellula sp.]